MWKTQRKDQYEKLVGFWMLDHGKSFFSPVIIIFLWFGLLTGTVEGGGSLLMQELQWQAWNLTRTPTPEIGWIGPVFDLIVFGVIMAAIAGIGKIIPLFPAKKVAVYLFSTMLLFELLPLSGRARAWYMLGGGSLAALWMVRWYSQHEAAALRFWRKTLPAL